MMLASASVLTLNPEPVHYCEEASLHVRNDAEFFWVFEPLNLTPKPNP